jgi:hypothetical protein
MFVGGKSADKNILDIVNAIRRIQAEGDGEEDSFAIFALADDRNYFVQALGRKDDKTMLAEAVSNNFLEPEFALSEEQTAQLLEMGWNPPEGKDSPRCNFWREPKLFTDANRQELARFLLRTLTEVYGYRPGDPLDVTLQLFTRD